MSCCFFLDTFPGPLLLYWRVLCLFGAVLVSLLVGFPLGAFLQMGVVRVDHGALVVTPGFDGDVGGNWISGPGGSGKRVRLNRKKLLHTW